MSTSVAGKRTGGMGKGSSPPPTAFKYEGSWVDGRMEGTGSITYPDGSVYVGAMKADQPQGQGAITYPDGATYDGELGGGLIRARAAPPIPMAGSMRARS
jgi:hypothetical protein